MGGELPDSDIGRTNEELGIRMRGARHRGNNCYVSVSAEEASLDEVFEEFIDQIMATGIIV